MPNYWRHSCVNIFLETNKDIMFIVFLRSICFQRRRPYFLKLYMCNLMSFKQPFTAKMGGNDSVMKAGERMTKLPLWQGSCILSKPKPHGETKTGLHHQPVLASMQRKWTFFFFKLCPNSQTHRCTLDVLCVFVFCFMHFTSCLLASLFSELIRWDWIGIVLERHVIRHHLLGIFFCSSTCTLLLDILS